MRLTAACIWAGREKHSAASPAGLYDARFTACFHANTVLWFWLLFFGLGGPTSLFWGVHQSPGVGRMLGPSVPLPLPEKLPLEHRSAFSDCTATKEKAMALPQRRVHSGACCQATHVHKQQWPFPDYCRMLMRRLDEGTNLLLCTFLLWLWMYSCMFLGCSIFHRFLSVDTQLWNGWCAKNIQRSTKEKHASGSPCLWLFEHSLSDALVYLNWLTSPVLMQHRSTGGKFFSPTCQIRTLAQRPFKLWHCR